MEYINKFQKSSKKVIEKYKGKEADSTLINSTSINTTSVNNTPINEYNEDQSSMYSTTMSPINNYICSRCKQPELNIHQYALVIKKKINKEFFNNTGTTAKQRNQMMIEQFIKGIRHPIQLQLKREINNFKNLDMIIQRTMELQLQLLNGNQLQ